MPSRCPAHPLSLRRDAAALAALLLLAAAAGAEVLGVAVARGPVSLPFYVAESRGHFQAEGVAVRLQDCASGRACFEQLAAGAADAATAAELLVTLSSLNEPRFTVIASVSSSVHQIKLVARRSAGIDAAAGLRGKRIGTVAGTSARYYLDRWLLYHGLGVDEVVLVALPPDRLAGALASRELDAVVVWEPHAAAARKALGGDVAALPQPRVYTQHFTLVTSHATLARREDGLARLLRALARAERSIADRPAEAAAILQTRLGLAPGEAEAQAAEHDYRLRIDQALVTTMDSQARWALQLGLAAPGARAPNMLRNIEPALLRKAVPGAVALVRAETEAPR
jgi:ABC-type nitrate/sulfonate/bicarbonate transport system substrate-binding protein